MRRAKKASNDKIIFATLIADGCCKGEIRPTQQNPFIVRYRIADSKRILLRTTEYYGIRKDKNSIGVYGTV